MRVEGIGPSIITAVKIQQITRRQPAIDDVRLTTIRDVLDLSPAALRAATGGPRQLAFTVSNSQSGNFLDSFMSIARRL